ncbi:MAG: hypothetical protein JWQ70_56 [Aeromicrobium sp.]|nr:hypothetical protein [Aeromicrobium sp.]
MARLLAAFDDWVARGPFTARDLAVFRIIFASAVLLMLPRVTLVAGRPDSFLAPPPGPFELMHTVPSEGMLLVLEILLMLAAASLCVGLFTTFSSLALSGLIMVNLGIEYSFGGLEHTIFLVLVPLTLAFSGWGRQWSLDSLRTGVTDDDEPQWPLRLLAAGMGVAFVGAAIPKMQAGWLDPTTHAVQGFVLRLGIHGHAIPMESVLDATPGWTWEILDVATVALELVVVLTVIHWPSFRVALAVLCTFHLGVLVFLDISFWQNAVAYGAFVSWTALPDLVRGLRRWLMAGRWRPSIGSLAAIGLIAVGTYACRLGIVSHGFDGGVTVLAGLVGILYLGSLIARRAIVWSPRM